VQLLGEQVATPTGQKGTNEVSCIGRNKLITGGDFPMERRFPFIRQKMLDYAFPEQVRFFQWLRS
jgi:hypothetical protein